MIEGELSVLASRTSVRAALAALAMTVALSGCGRRGALEAPPDPSAPLAAPVDDGVQPIPRRPKQQPIKPPHDSFILDPLL